jgi:hypothetical protein
MYQISIAFATNYVGNVNFVDFRNFSSIAVDILGKSLKFATQNN